MATYQRKPHRRKSVAIAIAICLAGQISLANNSLYEKGQVQLDNKEFQAAQNTFAELVSAGKEKQDMALYWLAYSQYKNGQTKAALASISKLASSHPDSRWLDDADALKIEIKDQTGQSLNIDDEEMKLYALNSLMNSPSERSIGILQRLLAGNSSNKIKHRALFVLSQIDDPQAFELIASLAEDSANSDLQKEAINVLGISGSVESLSVLTKVYRATDNDAMKAKILHSYMVAGQEEPIIALAKRESSPTLKKKAIHLIGVMSKPEVLLEMYRSPEFIDYREDILHGLAIGGGGQALVEIINTEKDQSLLVNAVQKMGITGDAQTSKKLVAIYTENNDGEIRKAVLHALFIQSNAKALAQIVKAEKDPELKREALQKLSIMGSDEALEFFENVLTEEG